MAFYAVRQGKIPGIYVTWDDAKKQITHYKNPVFRKFDSREEAEAFIKRVEQTQITQFFAPIEDPKENDKTLICFTDGSTLANGTANAKGGFAVIWPYHAEMDEAHHMCPCTNNKAEYSAIVHALKQANDLDPAKTKTLIIYTDSMLLVNSMTKWINGWKKNNWKKSDGQPVLNQDLIKAIDELTQSRKVCYRHVRAHTNADTWEAQHNDKADKLAKQAAMNP